MSLPFGARTFDDARRITRAQIVAGRALLELLNHPGHADQSSHGRKRRGGGSGQGNTPREAFARSKSVAEVEFQLRGRLKKALGRAVPVSLNGMDLDLAKEHAEGLLRAAERFPEAALAGVRTFGASPRAQANPAGTFAITQLGDISFNVGPPLDNPATYRSMLSESARTGFLVSGTPMGVALHEFGLVLCTPGVAGFARVAIEGAVSDSGDTMGDHVRDHVSATAATSGYELVAEAFTDVMEHGDTASDLSRLITATITENIIAASDGE